MGIIASVQSYDLNIPVGKSQAIDVAGDRVQFISAVDPFAQIEVRPNFAQGNITLKPGQGMRFSEQVQRWVVFNKGTVALTGTLLIGTGDFFDQRISGTVDVIDGGKARSLSNTAFTGFGTQGSSAGNYSRLQLWNPAGNTRRLIVENIFSIGVNVTGVAVIAVAQQAPLTSLYQNGLSKNLAGVASAAEVRYDVQPSAPPANGYLFVVGAIPVPGVQPSFKPSEPYIIPPGYGMTLWPNTANCIMAGNFEWYEEVF